MRDVLMSAYETAGVPLQRYSTVAQWWVRRWRWLYGAVAPLGGNVSVCSIISAYVSSWDMVRTNWEACACNSRILHQHATSISCSRCQVW